MAYFNPEHPIPRLSRRPGAYSSRRNDGVDYYNLHVIPTNMPPPEASFYMPYIPPPDFSLVQEPPSPSMSRTVAFNKKKNKARVSLRSNLIDLSRSSTVLADTFNTYSPNTAVNVIETQVNPVKEIESKSPYKYQHHADMRLKSESSNSPRYHPESNASRSSLRLDSPRSSKNSREEHDKKFYPKYHGSSRNRRKDNRYKNRGDWDARELHLSGKNTSKRSKRRYSSSHQKKETLEDVSDTALEDADFEEVEVASLEETKSEVRVGFRKCKVKYLPGKKATFFKPKIFYICPERTVINCSNWQEDDWKDQEEVVDVVSEEDYEMDTEVVSEEQTSNAVITEKSLPYVEVDVLETKSSKVPSKTDLTNDYTKTQVENKDTELTDFVSAGRKYQRFISGHQEFYQGETIIQSDIDAWKASLIGLSYIIEVRDISDDTNVLQHHCILCSDDIHAENDSGEMVINHVTSYKHMFKYLNLLLKLENFR